MSRSRAGFSARRRVQLVRRVAALEVLESKSMITESLGIMLAGIALPLGVAAMCGTKGEAADQEAEDGATRRRTEEHPAEAGTAPGVGPASALSALDEGEGIPRRRTRSSDRSDRRPVTPYWSVLNTGPGSPASESGSMQSRGAPQPSEKAAAGSEVGGASDTPPDQAFTPAAPVVGPGGASSIAPVPPPSGPRVGRSPVGLRSAGLAPQVTGESGESTPSGGGEASSTSGSTSDATQAGVASAGTETGFSGTGSLPFQPVDAIDTGLFLVDGGGGGASMASFTNFALYTLDYNSGTVLFPGFAQVGVPMSSVDLRAQVRDVDVQSYSWDTSNLTGAQSITGTSTYRLQFSWPNFVMQDYTASVTLTVTDVSSQTETQTYSFRVMATGSVGGGATWPTSVAPDQAVPGEPGFASHYVDVGINTGALESWVVLPTYSPNIAPPVLGYDSLAADPRPMILVRHELPSGQTTPTKTSAQLTFNGVAGSTYYYDTSQFNPGDFAQFALQKDATSLATGRYAYTATVVDYRTTNTTSTYSGNAIVVSPADEPFASLGKGWSLEGLYRLKAVTGGVILYTGSGDARWFAAGTSSGGVTSYTSPGGDFSTLTKTDATGVFVRTLADGTKQHFNASGYQTAYEDRNGLRVTYAYDASNRLTQLTDPFTKVTTFTYSSGKLQSIKDPANRLTTFAFTGSSPTTVTLPDGSSWGYTYDSAGRMTVVTDPLTRRVTVTYDSANRVGTISRPDATTQAFKAYQVRGFDTTGTSGSPAPATLLAEARATHTDPRGNSSDVRLDWRGLGRPNQFTDPAGNVATADVDANGLATAVIDRINRISRYQYDSKGNVTKQTLPDGNYQDLTYNGFSQVTSIRNERGKFTTLTYDAEGNLTEVRDPLNNRTTYTYTANGRVETVKDARSNVTTYQYDSQDRPTTITYSGGAARSVAYDSKGNAATVVDERSNPTTVSYDALNRITGTTDALGNRTTAVYDAAGNRTVVTEPLGRTTTYAYDALNRVTTITDALSHSTTLSYDASGNVRAVTDALARTTTFEYDALDRRTVVIDPLSNRATTTYDAEGQVVGVADRLNRVTTITYTSRGWRHTVTDPLGNTTTHAYTATGRPGTISDPNTLGSSLLSYTYDDADRTIAVTDALGHVSTATYDAVGNLVERMDANSNRTTFTYDARNRLETVKDALSNVTTYQYDGVGNRTVVIDPLGHRTTVAYDALNRVTTITDARAGITTATYDAAGRRSGLTDPGGTRTTWSYDAADRVTTVTDALGTATYSYDNADQLTDRTDRAGRRTTFAYDAAGRRTRERWLDGSGGTLRTITFTYDAEGQLTGATDPDATLTFTYDSAGRQETARTSSAAGQPDVTLTAGYSKFGERTSLVDNLSSVARTTYTYDAAHRLTRITRSLGGTEGPRVDFGYDNADRRTSVTRSINATYPQVATTIAYDAADRVTTITHGKVVQNFMPPGTFTVTPLATFTYGYDAASRVTSETNAEGSVTYTYDDTNQLTGVGGARSESYGYDAAGNRNATGYSTGTGNRLTAAPGATFSYDAQGNRTGKTVTATGETLAYTWDHRDRLTGVVKRNSGNAVTMQATYTYDAIDRRIRNQVDADGAGSGSPATTWTVYDGPNPYADFDGSGSLQQRYLHGTAVDELLARTSSGGATAWYLTDRLNSVRDVSDSTGAVIYHAAYDGFGRLTAQSGSGGDRFKFSGREYDSATGLYHNRNREYDPETGRFMSPDPIGFDAGDANLYRYVGNSPVNSSDPLGLADPSVTDAFASYASAMLSLIDMSTTAPSSSSPWTGGGDALDTLSNFWNGFADRVTFGMTGTLHRWMGTDPFIDPSSDAYWWGDKAGMAWQLTAGYLAGGYCPGTGNWAVTAMTAYGRFDTGVALAESARNIATGQATAWDILNFAPFIGKHLNSPNCFVAGTQVLMAEEPAAVLASAPASAIDDIGEGVPWPDWSRRLLGAACVLIGVGGYCVQLRRAERRGDRFARSGGAAPETRPVGAGAGLPAGPGPWPRRRGRGLRIA